MMRESHSAVLERDFDWEGDFEVEPYEVAWASEAIYFVRGMQAEGVPDGATARVQISPDGIHWCDEGTKISLPARGDMTFARVRHFGGWLRLVGTLPEGTRMRALVYLVLKE